MNYRVRQIGFTIIIILLALVGAIGLLKSLLLKPVQYALLCETNRTGCKSVRAQFSYDTGDGQFVVRKLFEDENNPISYSGTECWVKVEGSGCMDSSTNTSSGRIIIPLAHQTSAWRWEK